MSLWCHLFENCSHLRWPWLVCSGQGILDDQHSIVVKRPNDCVSADDLALSKLNVFEDERISLPVGFRHG